MAAKKTVADLVKARLITLDKMLVKLNAEYVRVRDERNMLDNEYYELTNLKPKVVERPVVKERERVSLEELKGMSKLDAVKALKEKQLSVMDAKKIIEDNNLYQKNHC